MAWCLVCGQLCMDYNLKIYIYTKNCIFTNKMQLNFMHYMVESATKKKWLCIWKYIDDSVFPIVSVVDKNNFFFYYFGSWDKIYFIWKLYKLCVYENCANKIHIKIYWQQKQPKNANVGVCMFIKILGELWSNMRT
jgi:hypothetical protein